MPSIADLPTPALVLDRAILARNLARMADRMRSLGVDLRPHLKTAKSDVVGRLAVEGFSGGITVSTLAEARWLAARGFRDITYGVGIAPRKLDEVMALRRAGVDLHVLTDDPDAVPALAAAAASDPAGLPVLLEVDSGQGRAGLLPADPALVALGRALHDAPGVTLRGVLTHGGHSYRARGAAECAAVAEEERRAIVAAAAALRAAGLPCPVVSSGSTPTAAHAADLTGVTEMRPGVYMFMDLDQAGIGAGTRADIAVSVLATVVGRASARGEAICDAGGLALSKDQSALAHTPQAGYGLVADAPVPDLAVVRCSQEHGVLGAPGGIPAGALAYGQRLRILPHHACFTAAAYDRYHVVDSDLDGGVEVVDEWERANGW